MGYVEHVPFTHRFGLSSAPAHQAAKPRPPRKGELREPEVKAAVAASPRRSSEPQLGASGPNVTPALPRRLADEMPVTAITLRLQVEAHADHAECMCLAMLAVCSGLLQVWLTDHQREIQSWGRHCLC